MDAANEQNARLRELNQRFAAEINSTRKAAGDAESDAKRSAATASEFVALAKAENAQLKRVNEELSAELAAANKATEAARAAAREKATAGEEMVRLSNEENVKLRDVNVQLIAALKNAQRERKGGVLRHRSRRGARQARFRRRRDASHPQHEARG